MEDDVLGKIVAVEKDIHDRLETEKNKTQGWLEKVKKDTEKEHIVVEKELYESMIKALQDTKRSAETKASEIINDAKAKAERLENLSDEILKEIISRHINRILSEK